MRILLALLLLVSVASAATNQVSFDLGVFTSDGVAYKPVRIRPSRQSFPRAEGSQVIGIDYGFKTTDATGKMTNAMVTGTYDIEFTNRFLMTTFQITTPATNCNCILTAAELTTSGTNLPSNLAAYSQTAADAMFAKRTNAIQKILTNGVQVGFGVTNLDFVSGVTGYVSGATVKLGVSAAGSGDVTTAQLNTASNLLSATKLGKTNDTATALTVRGAVGATVPTFVVGNSNLTTTNFVVATNGNVAVGTNSPSHNLSVAGNFGAAPNEGTYQFVVAADTGALNIGEGEAELKPGQMILKYSGPLGIQVINNDLDASEPQFRVSPGASLTVVSNNGPYHSGTVTPSRVALWDAARGLTNSANVDATELGYSDGLTSAIQTQLDGKAGNGVTNSFTKTQDTRGHTNTGTVRLEATSSTAAILPLAHITYDFGSLALQWRTGYFDSLRASNINALVSITTDTLNADELVLTNNPFQAGSAALTNLAANPIPFTNILVAGWGQALTTNSGVVTVTATNRGASIATNATSTTVGFSDTENVQIYNTWWHLTTNLVVSPTNLVVGRTICIRFDTNSLTYDVTVTNTAANPINWNFNVSTNGQTSFTKTNTLRARLYLTAETNGVISADFGYYR